MPYAFTFNIQCNWNWNFCLKNPHFSMLKIYRIILNSHLFLVLRYWSFKYIDMNILYTCTWQIYAHFWLKHTGCWISTGLHTRTHRYTTTHNLGVSSNACIANYPISVSWFWRIGAKTKPLNHMHDVGSLAKISVGYWINVSSPL